MQDLASTLAGYRLHEAIGRDAMSTTYRADAPGQHRRTVALQVSDALADEVHRRRATVFQRSATAAMDVEHAGVAELVDVGMVGDRVYAATAWRPSITLDQMIGRHWRMSSTDASAMLAPLAAGLDAAHAAGVVHGALSPRSIRIAMDGPDGRPQAFATGFGVNALLALRIGARRDRDGTPVIDDLLYVAPEQLRGDRVEPVTDQYALACALYHCLTGQPPFVRETTSGLFGAHLFARPPVIDGIDGPVNAAARFAVATGLTKTPDERHPSCGALVRAARAGTNGQGSTAAVVVAPGTAAPVDEPLGAGDRLRMAGAATAAWLGRLPRAALVGVGGVATLAILAWVAAGPVTGPQDPPQAVVAGDDAAADPADDAQPQDPGTAGDPDVPAPPDPVRWTRPVTDARVQSVMAIDGALVATSDTVLSVLDPETGESRWQRPVEDGPVAAATVTDDAVVYRSASQMTAHSVADGRVLWSRDDQYTPTGSLTAVRGGPLYGMGPGRIVPELMALDPGSGVEEWHFHGEDVLVEEQAGVAAADDVAIILQAGTMFAIDPDSELGPSGEDRVEIEAELWAVDVTDPWVSSVRLLDDAVVFARRSGAVCAHGLADGTQLWCTPVDGAADRPPQLLLDDDQAVAVTRRAVTALDARTGDTRWNTAAIRRINATTLDGSTVVVADGARLRALGAADGSEQWTLRDVPGVTSLSADVGSVYAGSRDGEVLRLQRPRD